MSDMYSMPLTVGGIKPFSSFGCWLCAPKMMCVVGLVKSRSNKPTLHPLLSSSSPSVVAIRLFPTPPLPLETAIILLIPLSLSAIVLVLGSTMLIWFPLCFEAKFLVLG
jgi:hypothetical protein